MENLKQKAMDYAEAHPVLAAVAAAGTLLLVLAIIF